jgi:TPR repeat protein
MKKLLIICCAIIPALCISQTKPVNPRVHRAVAATKNSGAKYELEDKNDSAHIYYMKGWDSYKLKDIDAARYYWERGAACVSNIPSKYSSAFRYGLMLQNGEGITADKDAAFYYYNLGSADGKPEGDVDATKNVAAYYENGMSVQQDFKKALEWYLKAKAQGNKFCDSDIARVRKKIAQGL